MASGEKPMWQQSSLYSGYLRTVQEAYLKKPVVRASMEVLLSVFTVVFFGFFAIRPTLATVSNLLKQIEDQKAVDAKLDNKIGQLLAAEEFLDTRGVEVKALGEAAVPFDPEVDRFSQMLELVANETGVSLITMEIQNSPLVGEVQSEDNVDEELGDFNFVTLGFSVGGKQPAIEQFLAQMERMERVVLLTNVEMTIPQTNFGKVFDLITTARATIYYLPEAE